MGNICHSKMISCCNQISEDLLIEEPKSETITKNSRTLILKNGKNKKKSLDKVFFDEMAINSASMRSRDHTLNTNTIYSNTKDSSSISYSPVEKLLTNSLVYVKMISGERIHNYLESIFSYDNKVLLKAIINLLNEIKNTYTGKNFKKITEIYTFFNNCYLEINDKKIINNIEKDINDSEIKIKFYLIDIIELLVEIYHFFQFELANGKEPYDEFYWYNIKNIQIYMKNKVASTFREIENLNNFLIENKLMNTNSLSSRTNIRLLKALNKK